ncbi:hypothetical protein OJ998_10110 [Solirubrobacter taibaiensis]|nr:hypothetical protein [Solirubrobacter taibaiensis]
MDSAGALSVAVRNCINTREHPRIEVREKALADVRVLLEGIVRDGLSDRALAASLDGLAARNVTCDWADALHLVGVLWTLGLPRAEGWVLPVKANLSLQPEAVSIVRVASRCSLMENPRSERGFQRAWARVAWHETIELRLG